MPMLLIIIAAAIVSIASYHYFVMPFVWIFVALLLALLVAVKISRRTYAKAIFLNLACAVLVIGGFETYYAIDSRIGKGQQRTQTFDTGGAKIQMNSRDDVLGYAPIPNQRGVRTKHYEDELVYEMNFTIGPDGLRVAPPDQGWQDIACILFFGASDTFGSGLNDEETLPYRVGLKTGGRFRVKTFAVGGYGPHQMLAAIESKIVDQTTNCRPIYAIYTAAPGHARRVIARTSWDKHGPRYEFDAKGTPVRRGNFDDPPDRLLDRRHRDQLLKSSFLYKRLVINEATPEAIELMAAIIDKSGKLIESKYPGIRFLVLMRNSKSDISSRIDEQFRERDIEVHSIAEIYAASGRDRAELAIKNDGHPTALANEIVADYVVEHILRRQ